MSRTRSMMAPVSVARTAAGAQPRLTAGEQAADRPRVKPLPRCVAGGVVRGIRMVLKESASGLEDTVPCGRRANRRDRRATFGRRPRSPSPGTARPDRRCVGSAGGGAPPDRRHGAPHRPDRAPPSRRWRHCCASLRSSGQGEACEGGEARPDGAPLGLERRGGRRRRGDRRLHWSREEGTDR